MARNRRYIEDLSEYDAADDIERIGMAPLAIGFLQRKQRYEEGEPDAALLDTLLAFCHPDLTVARLPRAMPCPLCGKRIEVEIDGETVGLGSAEIRVLGEADIYAAPDLLPHYIAVHNYLPPDEFIAALRQADPNAIEYRVLINTLR